MVRKLNRRLSGWKVSVNHFYLLCVWNCIGYASGHGQEFFSELWLILIKFSLQTTVHVTETPCLGLNCLKTRIALYSLLVNAWLLWMPAVVISGWNGFIYLLGCILNWRTRRKKNQVWTSSTAHLTFQIYWLRSQRLFSTTKSCEKVMQTTEQLSANLL